MIRRVIQADAATLAALGSVPPVIARALAIAPDHRTGTIDDVDHVIVLMQENRSFDHYFGTLRGVRGFGDRFTIPLPGGRSVWEQSNGSRIVMPYPLDGRGGNAQRIVGTPHDWADAQAAWDHGRMAAWPMHKGDHAMAHYMRSELPFHFAMCEAFTVCDAYHCAQHGGTNPNRLFLWSGSNGASAAGAAAVVNEWDDFGPASEGYEWTTYPERLQAAGISWKVYQNLPDNFTDNPLAGFRRFRAAAERTGRRATFQYDESMDAAEPLLKGVANTMPDGGMLGAFRDDITQGTLPQVSWIIAPAAYSEHPSPSSPVQGGWYMHQILDALAGNPKVWSRTALFITFDENDGFFDHVPPPAPPFRQRAGDPAGKSTCDVADECHTHPPPHGCARQPAADGSPYGMGPRVPMIVVSPWSRGGWVNSQVFDHTSIIRFMERRFGVVEPNISTWRRTVAGDLLSAFDFARVDDSAASYLRLARDHVDGQRARQEQLPPIPVPDASEQRRPTQEPGTRPSRALPYDFSVDARTDSRHETVLLDMRNSGRAGAVLHVYDKLHLDRLPRRYTIGAGHVLDDLWDAGEDAGQYDLWLIGPNGFHRAISGNLRAEADLAGSTPEIVARHDRDRCALIVTMINTGTRACVFRVVANAYRTEAPRHALVPPGSFVDSTWHLDAEQGWYDLSFGLPELPGYARRIAGRVETGRDGISDPAFGPPRGMSGNG